MRYISEKEYNSRMKQIEQINRGKERKQKLKQAERKFKPKFKLPSTSKLMAAYLFVILNVVLCYAMIAMWNFQDLTYLGVLITDVAAQVLTYFIYTKKATAENTSADGTGIKFQAMMNEFKEKQNQNGNNADESAEESSDYADYSDNAKG